MGIFIFYLFYLLTLLSQRGYFHLLSFLVFNLLIFVEPMLIFSLFIFWSLLRPYSSHCAADEESDVARDEQCEAGNRMPRYS